MQQSERPLPSPGTRFGHERLHQVVADQGAQHRKSRQDELSLTKRRPAGSLTRHKCCPDAKGNQNEAEGNTDPSLNGEHPTSDPPGHVRCRNDKSCRSAYGSDAEKESRPDTCQQSTPAGDKVDHVRPQMYRTAMTS